MKKDDVADPERPRPRWPDMSKPWLGSRAMPRPDPLWVRFGRWLRRLFSSG
jgi:hypothetical protein